MLPDGRGGCDGSDGSLLRITGPPGAEGVSRGTGCRFRGPAQPVYAEGAFFAPRPARTGIPAASVRPTSTPEELADEHSRAAHDLGAGRRRGGHAARAVQSR